jgi:succinyl-diaminopimelate desuccinylase
VVNYLNVSCVKKYMSEKDHKEILDEIVKLTKELILFRTTEDRKEELNKCIAFIKNYFNGSNVKIDEFNFKDKPSLFISFNGKKKQTLILNGHIDVVEGFDSQFVPEEKDGKIFGRGANDMKASVAVMIVLMKHLSEKKNPPKVGLMLVSDEEIGGDNGTKILLKKGYKANFCLIGEPSKFHVETKHKGVLQVKVKAYGSSSHSSRPWLGDNAIEKMMKQYKRLINEVPVATRKHKWLTSINPTNIIAQGPYNVTPSKAEMIMDIRTSEEYTNKKIMELMKKCGMKFTLLRNAPMMLNKKKNKDMRTLKKIAEKVLDKKVKYIKSCGGSDGRYFTGKNIPTVNFGPYGKNHHKAGEHMEITCLDQYYKILEKFIQERIK